MVGIGPDIMIGSVGGRTETAGIIFGTGTVGYADPGGAVSPVDRSCGWILESSWAGGAWLYPCGTGCAAGIGDAWSAPCSPGGEPLWLAKLAVE
jgi:hypothetical protein